jgi:hypothetical protein
MGQPDTDQTISGKILHAACESFPLPTRQYLQTNEEIRNYPVPMEMFVPTSLLMRRVDDFSYRVPAEGY